MLHYTISYQRPHLHWLDFELTAENIDQAITELQLPAWRPGRYELGNFAKNIQRFSVTDADEQALPLRKTQKDRWEVDTRNTDTIIVRYNYYAAELNAGSTWLDEEQLYINFVNCMLYVEGRQEEAYRIKLKLPSDYEIACGLLETKKHTLEAPSFYHLAESPMIASASLTHWQYAVADSRFHLWIQGKHFLNEADTIAQFRAFTKVQIQTMGDFPCQDYHFLYHILPYRAYHGVEHFNSTVITLGPADQLVQPSSLHADFLGVSSHELFHTWNIIRIRPQEMMPYNYTRENYFPTGFIAEGVTTYYGDLFLVRSGVITQEEYFLELNKLFKRHFHNYGRFNHSLVDSSLDLWLDGYQAGIPDRTVSIYVKGALVSLILDLTLRQLTGQEQSLDTFMRYLWDIFGKKARGYTMNDLQRLVEDLSGHQLPDYFERFITGTEPLETALDEALQTVGCTLHIADSAFYSEGRFGFSATQENGHWLVQRLAPDGPAAEGLSLRDEIVSVNGVALVDHLEGLLNEPEIILLVKRQQRTQSVTLTAGEETYFKVYTVEQRPEASEGEHENLGYWLGHAKAQRRKEK